MTITDSDKTELLTLVRKRIEDKLIHNTETVEEVSNPNLKDTCGVFVTLTKEGQLRGCIGRIQSEEPLYQTVQIVAVESALRDPRFSPVTRDEIEGIEIEISVLSPPARVVDISAIEIGKHGLIMSYRSKSSVYLPQVPVENAWNLSEYISNLAQKAGISSGEISQSTFFSFTATVFSE